MNVDVVEVADSILAVPIDSWSTKAASIRRAIAGGVPQGSRWPLGSSNMVSFRYRRNNVPCGSPKPFTADGIEFPAGSFVISPTRPWRRPVRPATELGLTGAALASVLGSDATPRPPRVAIYTQWTGTQNLGWYPTDLRRVRDSP
ncbi:MAG: hypothetical protein R2909_22100 [Gemmatimonadales bacterium]